MPPIPDLPPALFESIPWNPEPEAIWVASSLSLRRNLARHNFPSKLPDTEVNQVLDTLKGAITKNEGIQNSKFFTLNSLSSSDRELIFERFLFLKGLQEPPNGSALVMNENGDLLALMNTKNHLEIRITSLTPQWETQWNLLSKIENQLGSNLEFAFSPKFGYLTSDPACCGTGLTVQAFLHLPALIHTNKLQEALGNIQEDTLLFMGLSGNLEDLIGDLIVVSNNYSIGMSEEAILRAIQLGATKLVGAEKTIRDHLKNEPNTEVKNLVSKAFGLIVHSYQLETKEALNLLSLLKLGLSLNYITNVSEQKLNELFFKCRRGLFSHLFPDSQDPKVLGQKRANFLQKELEGITLSPELQ